MNLFSDEIFENDSYYLYFTSNKFLKKYYIYHFNGKFSHLSFWKCTLQIVTIKRIAHFPPFDSNSDDYLELSYGIRISRNTNAKERRTRAVLLREPEASEGVVRRARR